MSGEPAPAGGSRTVRWLIAKTPVDAPYPCRCSRAGSCKPRWCPCAGRLDLDDVPAGCCAHTNTPAVAARAQADSWRNRQ